MVLLVVYLVIMTALLLAVWSRSDDPSPTRSSTPETDTPPARDKEASRAGVVTASTAAAAGAEPKTLEGALVAGVIDHEISQRQYHRAMERLAARDESYHPMTVPSPNDKPRDT